jgi:hypothetical protein
MVILGQQLNDFGSINLAELALVKETRDEKNM